MKVHEIEYFPESLSIMFNHFKKFDIKSSLTPVDDYNALYLAIMNSEFHHYQYIDSLNDYSINFHLEEISFVDKVYYFLCRKQNEESSFNLLIDFVRGPGISFLKFTSSLDNHPPFTKGFLDSKGNIMISTLNEREEIQYVSHSEILSLSSFEKLIDVYSSPDKLVIVELE